VADFLATAGPLDGIIFPSAQLAGDSRNVVRFHKAARVEALAVPEGAMIEARSGQMYEEGYEIEYVVTEETPPADAEALGEDDLGWPSLPTLQPPYPDARGGASDRHRLGDRPSRRERR
jgi:hypothetical protein